MLAARGANPGTRVFTAQTNHLTVNASIYHFKPLDERVEVYSKPFRLVQDVTILATPEVQKLLSTQPTVTIAATIDYQACDDRICYNPARVPIRFTVAMKPLDRQ
jgi:hypothetical protein